MNVKRYEKFLREYAAGLIDGCDMIRCIAEFDGTSAASKAIEKMIKVSNLPSMMELEAFVVNKNSRKR